MFSVVFYRFLVAFDCDDTLSFTGFQGRCVVTQWSFALKMMRKNQWMNGWIYSSIYERSRWFCCQSLSFFVELSTRYTVDGCSLRCWCELPHSPFRLVVLANHPSSLKKQRSSAALWRRGKNSKRMSISRLCGLKFSILLCIKVEAISPKCHERHQLIYWFKCNHRVLSRLTWRFQRSALLYDSLVEKSWRWSAAPRIEVRSALKQHRDVEAFDVWASRSMH